MTAKNFPRATVFDDQDALREFLDIWRPDETVEVETFKTEDTPFGNANWVVVLRSKDSP